MQAFVALGRILDDAPAPRTIGSFEAQVRRAAYEAVGRAPVRPLLPRLGFVRDKGSHWGMAFRRGLFAVDRRRTSPSSRRRCAMAEPAGLTCVGAIAGGFGVAGRGAAEVVLRRPRRHRRLRAARHRGRPQLRRASVLRPIPGAFAARLTGIATREEAEALKGTRLYAPRDRLPPLADDEFYHADLIGLAVVDTGGAPLGTVRAVLDHGAGDILEIARPGAPDLLLPFTRAAVPTVDLAAGRIVADPPEALARGCRRRGQRSLDRPRPHPLPGDVPRPARRTRCSAGRWPTASGGSRSATSATPPPTATARVDDTPAGGGAGMVLRADIAAAALDAAAAPTGRSLYLSPRGAPFTQARARALAAGPGVTLLCGRFEGIDERVLAGARASRRSASGTS